MLSVVVPVSQEYTVSSLSGLFVSDGEKYFHAIDTRSNSNVTKRNRPGDNDVRCEACWLKLCLIGYNLDTPLYDKLR